MTHIFKPGDRAYWVKHNQWVTLKEYTHRDYPLTIEEGEGGFTLDGRFIWGSRPTRIFPGFWLTSRSWNTKLKCFLLRQTRLHRIAGRF